MHFDHHDQDLVAGFEAVRQIAPDTYDAMMAETWHITTDIFDLPGDMTMTMLSNPRTLRAEGLTISGNEPGMTEPHTWINTVMIRAELDGADVVKGVTFPHYLGEILAHEFRHIHAPRGAHTEQEAFAAGTAFSRRIPGPDGPRLVALSDETAAYERRNPVAYNPVAYGPRLDTD